jgi:DNA repair photolyase
MSETRYFEAKKAGHGTRERKGLLVKPNGRSADFIIPSFVVGCELACSYCYVARHRPFGKPLALMTNREAIWEGIASHYQTLGPKAPNQTDPLRWTYDIGESSDCLTPKVVESMRWFIQQFLNHTEAKPTFATKVAGARFLDAIQNHGIGRARVRISLMPQHIADVVERGTSRIDARIAEMDRFLAKGYEVHLNFSPVIAYQGWVADYRALCRRIDSIISPEVKSQLKAEVIFLTHHPALHEQNLSWRPEAESLLWTPQWQESKRTQQGDAQVVRYQAIAIKQPLIDAFRQVLAEELPYCMIRYIF